MGVLNTLWFALVVFESSNWAHALTTPSVPSGTARHPATSATLRHHVHGHGAASHAQHEQPHIDLVDYMPKGQNYYNLNISLLLAVYYDTVFLLDILRQFEKFVAELVVVDGPRRNSTKLLKVFGMMYDERTSPVRAFLDTEVAAAFPQLKVRYVFDVWADEKRQRDAGFDMCTGPVVMMADSDMFVRLNPAAMAQFVRDPNWARGVAGLSVTVLQDLQLGSGPMSAHRDSSRAAHHKAPQSYRQNVMASKLYYTADRFFDHLSIVGTPQNKSDLHLFPTLVGVSDHLTVMRTLNGTIAKYAFYFSLLAVNAPLVASMKRVVRRWGSDVAKKVFARSFVNGICILNLDDNKVLIPPPIHLSAKKNVMKKVCTHAFISKTESVALVPPHDASLLLPDSVWAHNKSAHLCLRFSNINTSTVDIVVYNNLQHPKVVLTRKVVDGSELNIALPQFGPSTHYVLLRFTASELSRREEVAGFVTWCDHNEHTKKGIT